MKIVIDNKTLKLLKAKGVNSLQILVKGCESSGAGESQPSVTMGKPKSIETYNIYEVENIDVYVHSSVVAKDGEIQIKYLKFLWSERLTVDGILI